MDNNLEYQVIIMQYSNEKLASGFTEMKYDTKKRDSESTNIRSDMN